MPPGLDCPAHTDYGDERAATMSERPVFHAGRPRVAVAILMRHARHDARRRRRAADSLVAGQPAGRGRLSRPRGRDRRRGARRAVARASTSCCSTTGCRTPTASTSSSRSRSADPDTLVILLTAYSSVDTAVEAMKQGAYHYANKPFNLDEIALLVEKALETTRLRREVRALRARAGAALQPRSHRRRERRRSCAMRALLQEDRGEPGVDGAADGRERHRQGSRREGAFTTRATARRSRS